MAWRPVELSCPSCEATVRTDLDALVADGGGERIRGRDLSCRVCSHEFAVYYF
jgi:hypothetical protein